MPGGGRHCSPVASDLDGVEEGAEGERCMVGAAGKGGTEGKKQDGSKQGVSLSGPVSQKVRFRDSWARVVSDSL